MLDKAMHVHTATMPMVVTACILQCQLMPTACWECWSAGDTPEQAACELVMHPPLLHVGQELVELAKLVKTDGARACLVMYPNDVGYCSEAEIQVAQL